MKDEFDQDLEVTNAAGESGNLLSLLPVIAWQRKWLILIPSILGAIGAVAAYFLITPLYLANAVMLVVSPQLPDDVMGFNGTEVIDRRIARIRQQITSRPDLIRLIEQQGLYPSKRQSGSLADAVEEMRESISITPNQVEGQRGDDNTIAFELSFSYPQPVQAQAVTQTLMENILSLDSIGNVEQAENTEQFLQDQATDLASQISQLQSNIARLTAANSGALAAGGQIISSNSGSFDLQISALRRENQQLISQRGIALSSAQRDPIVQAAEQQLAGARGRLC